ncbi:MAG: type II secretion system F family protein [Alphaproteobacteria bacterium]|nr:type II secretion system F family protein [Alphaproteobacteria bacterium]
MSETMATICCFFVALISFYILLPYAKKTVIGLISDYRILVRIKKLPSSQEYYEDDSDDVSSESIGLSQKGSVVGDSALFNYIAQMNSGLIEEMQELLLKAGMRQRNAMEEFMKSKFNAAIAIFFISFLIFSTNDWDIPLAMAFGLSLIASIYGCHKLTNMNLEMIAEKRREAIEHGVPDLIDLLVICSESGLDLNGSIKRIARELRTSNPILADEMSLTAIELEMIPDSRQVFINLENRTNSLQIKTLSKTLSQSIEYGSSLSTSLRDLAVESRQKRMLDAEAAAAQAPTLLTLPMMFFIMPCLFIVMLGPVVAGMIRSFSGGGS